MLGTLKAKLLAQPCRANRGGGSALLGSMKTSLPGLSKACWIWISMGDIFQSEGVLQWAYLVVGKLANLDGSRKGCCFVFQRKKEVTSPTQQVLERLAHAVKK